MSGRLMADQPAFARLAAPRRIPRHRPQQYGMFEYLLVGAVVATLGMRVLEFFPWIAVVKPIVLVVGIALLGIAWKTEGAVFSLPLKLSAAKWILVFHVWVIACIPTSIWQGPSIAIVKGMVPLLAGIWVILASPISLRSAHRMQWLFAIGVTMLATLNVVMGSQQFDGRYGGSIGMDVNDIALVLVSALPLVVGLALRSTGLTRLALWTAVALVVMVAMRTGSRGGTLGLIAGTAVMLAGTPWRRTLQLLLLGVPLAFVTWSASPESFRTRMISLFAGEADYNQTDDNGRIAIWKRGVSYGMANPVLGVGPGAFIQADGIGKAERGLQGKWSVAHNIYVQAFAELGVPGLLLFLACVGSVARSCLAVYRGARVPPALRRPEYLAALVSFLVAATFLSFLFYQMTWVLLAGLASMAVGTKSALAGGVPEVNSAPRREQMRRRGFPARRHGYAASTRA